MSWLVLNEALAAYTNAVIFFKKCFGSYSIPLYKCLKYNWVWFLHVVYMYRAEILHYFALYVKICWYGLLSEVPKVVFLSFFFVFCFVSEDLSSAIKKDVSATCDTCPTIWGSVEQEMPSVERQHSFSKNYCNFFFFC